MQKKKDQDEIAGLKRQLADAQQSLSALTAKYNAIDEQARRDQVALAGLRASLDASETSLAAGNKRIAELEGQSARDNDAMAQLRKDVANTQADLIATKEALNGSVLENKRLADEVARLNKALADANAAASLRDTKLREAEARASKDAADMAALKVRGGRALLNCLNYIPHHTPTHPIPHTSHTPHHAPALSINIVH